MWPTTKVQSSRFKVQSLGLNLAPRTLNLEPGFAVLEFLIASTIFIIVVLAVYLMYETNQATFAKGEKDADLQQNARVAMDRIIRELRMAGFDPQAAIIPTPCATAIQSATATSIRFITNTDEDATPERVEYTYDSRQKKIKREAWPSLTGSNCFDDWSSSGGAKSLAEKISSVTFVYRDASNACIPNADCTPGTVAAADLGNIRRITISITASDTLPNQEIRSYTMTSEVKPRNLGL